MRKPVVRIRFASLGFIGFVTVTGCDVRPAPRSLIGAETTMVLRTDVAETHLSLVANPGALGGASPESHLAVSGEGSLFREAEVAPGKVAETRALLSELGAQEASDRSIRFALPADILFDFDKATLRPDASAALEKAARLVTSYPEAPLLVAGHTDAKGDEDYNIELSERRAQTVALWLKAKSARDVGSQGLGERQPVAPNIRTDGSDNPEGRQRNRRVEIIMLPSRSAAGQ